MHESTHTTATRHAPRMGVSATEGHPPAISPAATDRLPAGYTSLTSRRRRAMSAALDRSAAIGQRAITISAAWARGGPC